jgi:hypothetical protein
MPLLRKFQQSLQNVGIIAHIHAVQNRATTGSNHLTIHSLSAFIGFFSFSSFISFHFLCSFILAGTAWRQASHDMGIVHEMFYDE